MRVLGSRCLAAVAGLGDFNGDGLPDVALSGPEDVYVVYGKANTNLVDVDQLDGSNVFGFRAIPRTAAGVATWRPRATSTAMATRIS